MKLNGIKRIGFLAVAMVIAFSAFALAVCPPGAVDLNAFIAAGAPWAATAPVIPLAANTTYCVTSDLDLTAAGPATVVVFLQLANNTRVVGAHPGVRVDGDAVAGDPVFQINGTGAVIEDVNIRAGAAQDHGVEVLAVGSDSVVRNVVIDDTVAVGAGFTTAHVEILGGLNVSVEGSTIRNAVTPVAALVGVLINGGNEHHVVDNRCEILAGGEPLFVSINSNVGNGHDVLRNTVVNQIATTAIQLRVATTNSKVNANTISLGGGAGAPGVGPVQAIGILIGNAMIDCIGNTISNPGGFAVNGALLGIDVVVAGTNALVKDNRVTGCGTQDAANAGVGDAVRVAAANVVVEENPMLQTGLCAAGLLDIACGVRVVAGASNVSVLNNPNINSATSGVLVQAPSTEVRGNTITDACTGAAVPGMAGGAGATPSGITVEQPGAAGAPIADNVIMNVSQRGAVLGTTRAGGDGITLANVASNVYVANNQIRNAANHGIDVEAAACVGTQITGNTVELCSNNGFNIVFAANNQFLSGNTFENNLENGVFVGGGALNCTVLDNDLINNGASGSPLLAPTIAESLVLTGGANNAEILDNRIRSSVNLPENRGIRVEGVRNVIVDGNHVWNNDGTLTHGMVIETGVVNSEFTENEIEGMIEIGIVIRGGSATLGEVNVHRNLLINDTLGILFDGGASVLEGNCIDSCCAGFRVTAGVPVNNHTFENNCVCIGAGGTNGRNESATGTFVAENNWWSDTSASKFVGAIDYQPYLADCPHAYCPDCGPGPVPPAGPTHTYGAAAGWYMVSRPRNSDTTANPFGAVAYSWNPVTGVYDTPTTVEPDGGYWMLLPANTTVTDDGSQVATDVTINLSSVGWHQISCPWNGLPKSAIKVTKGGVEKSWADAMAAGWIRDDIYTYAPTSVNYTMPTTLNAWMGYWVKALVSGVSLKLPVSQGTIISAGASVAPKALVVPADLPPMPPTPTVNVESDLEFVNYPNPITDVHTTTFAVKGAAAAYVSALKVQIYDLAGRLVYEDEVAGASLDWHTDSDYGEYLANGVYLYKLYALVDGEWVVSQTKKLAILR